MDKINESIYKANISLVDRNKELNEENKNLKKRIDKVIEFILDKSIEYKPNYRKVDLNTRDCNELLNMLEGEIYE